SPNHPGGQCGLARATRADTDTDWSFGSVYEVDVRTANDEHYHSAYWTPNGVVISRGDGPVRNMLSLWTCDDWDNYATANWTEYRGQGLGADDALPAIGRQPVGGCAHGSDTNKFYVGSDLDYDPIAEVTVPSTPTDGLSLRWIWGAHWAGRDRDNANKMTGWLSFTPHRNTPESPIVTGGTPNPVDEPDEASAGRVIVSLDGGTFAPIARLPSTTLSQNPIFQFGDDIVTLPKGESSDYAFSIPVPDTIHRLT
ncbi:unnamed protein product, partial [marine sediment metagenome]